MFHIATKSLNKLRQASSWFVLVLLACLAGGVAQAQTLSFTPGIMTTLTSPTNTTDPNTGVTTGSAANYTGPLSGLVVNQPQGLTFDSQGDLFIVDTGAYVVRVVASGKGPIPSLPSVTSPVAGTVYTVAGIGSNTPSPSPLCSTDQRSVDNNFYGNGCPATDAILEPATLDTYPGYALCGQVALDAHGNLYIVDGGDNQVRVVYAGGTVPGLQAQLPAGVTTPVPGNIYAFVGQAYQDNGSGYVYGTYGYGAAPIGVAVDAIGDVYILSYTALVSGSGQDSLAVVYNGGTLPAVMAGAGQTLTVGQYYNSLWPLNYPFDFTKHIGGAPWPNSVASFAVDSSGNIYIGCSQCNTGDTSGVWVIYAGGTVPGLSAALQGQAPVVGNAYSIAGYSYGAGTSSNPVYPPGAPATQVSLGTPGQMTFDPAGDLHLVLSTSYLGYSAGFLGKSDLSGNFALYAGNLSYYVDEYSGDPVQNVCAATVDAFGDGCPANQVAMDLPGGMAIAADGSIYYDDYYVGMFNNYNAVLYALHKIDVSASALTFASQTAGVTSAAQVVSISNVDAKPLNISDINVPNNFTQVASGGTDCAAPVTLDPGQSCLLGVAFQAIQAGTYSDNITITSDSTNAGSGGNSIAVSGTATATTGTSAQKITFTAPSTAIYGQTITLNGTASSGLAVIYQVSGPARIQGSTLTVTGTGAITVTAYQPGDNGDTGNAAGWAAATPVPATITAQAALLTVTADNISQARTLPIPTLTYTITGFANGDSPATTTTGVPVLSTTATASSPSGSYPITITQGTLATTTNNYSLTAASFVNGTFTILSGSPQTITFTQTLPTVTYSVAPINLTGAATATSGLPVSYSVTGPATINGSTLTLTGAGTVVVTANQAGNATYAAASPVAQSFVVQPAPLTIIANNLTMAQSSVVPALTYTVSGLINGDTAANVVAGTPVLTTTATSSSPVGTYPITIALGQVTVLSTNYTLTSASFVNGTMTVVTGTPQTIDFGALLNVTYGVAPTVLSATASSGLPVTFSVASGPASITNNVLSVTGAGAVVVTASQGGNATYNAATPAKQSFTVAQVALTITANNVTRLDNAPNPPLTYTITGLVNGDTGSVLNEAPAISTTATPSSPPGTYPINVGPLGNFGDPLTAANYTINGFVAGVFTITSGGSPQDFTPSLSSPTMTILDGQVGQVTLTVTPVNYYGGIVNLSCTGLPANVSCIFSPPALNTSLAVTDTLTIATSNTGAVASLPQSGGSINSASIAGWTSLLFGIVLAWQRKRLARYGNMWVIAMAVCLFGMAVSMTACGGGSSSSLTGNGLAAPGTSTIQVVATDATSSLTHSLPLQITIK